MNPEISKRKRRQLFAGYLITGLLVNTTLNFQVAAQIGRPVLEAPAVCNVSVYENDKIDHKMTAKNGVVSSGKLSMQRKKFQLKANHFGIFPRITVTGASEIVPVEIEYPLARNGEKVVFHAIDGGNFDNGKNVKVVQLDNQKKCSLKFRVTDQQGIYRVVVRQGSDYKTIQVWMSAERSRPSNRASLLADLSPTGTTSATSQPPCGNNPPNGTGKPPCDCCDPKPPGGVFDAYTGNTHRAIKDLEVWNGVGEIPLVWMRYFNSRGGWTHSFRFRMFDEGFDSHGQPRIVVQYPEGGENLFTQDSNNPNFWVSAHGVENHLFQQGNIFFLQMPNGHRYRFERLPEADGITYYQLQDFRDSYQNIYSLTYNSDKSLKRVTEAAGRYLEVAYDVLHSTRVISKIRSNDGRSVNYLYDVYDDGINAQVRLTGAEYGDGTKASYIYHQSEPGAIINLEHAIDPRYEGTDANMRFTYDPNNIWGFLKEEINGKKGEVMATLTATDGFRTVCYPNGRVQVYKMPTSLMGEAEEYTDGLGRKSKYTYAPVRTITHAHDPGGVGFLFTVTDALGRVTTYNKRTIYGNPLEITHPDGSKEKWTRDDLDLPLTYQDELGRITTYTRDNRHRVTRILYPDKSIERFTYNNFAQVITHTLRNGGVERNVYNGQGLKTRFIDALGNITRYSYDGSDRLASVVDARGNITKHEYDERGLLIKMTNADNSFQSYSYDEFGNRTGITNEIKNTWTTTYDEFKRPVIMRDPLNRETKYSYDLPGGACGCCHGNNNPTQIILPSGKMTSIEYDIEWQKIKETVGAGTADAATTSFEYDLVGNLETLVDPRFRSWMYEYDLRDRRRAAADPLGNKTEWIYDLVGNILTEKRPDSGITSNVYDVMGRLVYTTNPKREAMKMSYDVDGNLLRIIDAKNNIYKYEHDLLDRRIRMDYPDRSFEGFTYDPVGNVTTYKTRAGQIRTYTYDSRNRETFSDWNDATPDISSVYDAANRIVRLSSVVSTLTYSYNSANQMISETQGIAGGPLPKTVTYSYNADGLQNSIHYSGGTRVSYNHSARNQVNAIANNRNVLVNYTYDLNGTRTSKILSNGTHTVYSYDVAGRLSTMNNQKSSVSFGRFDYEYDKMDRRKLERRSNGSMDLYTYDQLGQITGVNYDVSNSDGSTGKPARTVNYSWDNMGNRQEISDNVNTTTYESNNLNQYSNIQNQMIYHDGAGNLTSLNDWTYSYDAQNRLTKAVKPGAIFTFVYDPLNRCIVYVSQGTSTFRYYDDWNLIEEYVSDAKPAAIYVNGTLPDEIITMTSVAGVMYYYYDALGSVTELAADNGLVVEYYSYDIFGKPVIKNSNGTSIPFSDFGNRFLFTGRELLLENTLYDYRHRKYSADIGRFLQPDPLRLKAGDLNLYRYVSNNPVNKVDPFGLDENCYCVYQCDLIRNFGNRRKEIEQFLIKTDPGFEISVNNDTGPFQNFFKDINGDPVDFPAGFLGGRYNCQLVRACKYGYYCPKPNPGFPIPATDNELKLKNLKDTKWIKFRCLKN